MHFETRSKLLVVALDHLRPLWKLDLVENVEDKRTASTIYALFSFMLSPRRWADTAVELARLPGTVARELMPSGSPSPFAQTVTAEREVAFLQAPLNDFKAIEKAFASGITVNDVVLAVTASGMRKWLKHQNFELSGLRVKVPVSMHSPNSKSDTAANRDSFMIVDLPTEEQDPVRSLFDVHRETRERKQRHDADEIDVLFNQVYHVSKRLEGWIDKLTASPRSFSFSVSNVPGPKTQQYVLGGPVKELYSIAEIAQEHALRIAVISEAGTMYFGLCTDPNVVRGVSQLAVDINDAIDRLLALVPSEPRSARPLQQ